MRLVKYEAARKALAEAHRVDEAKQIRDKALAVAAYARQAKDGDMIAWATEIKIRAERRTGELLRETAEREERQRATAKGTSRAAATSTPSLKALGLTRDQSSDWQKLAALPAPEFERRLADARRDPAHMTTERILKPTPRRAEPDAFQAERIWDPVAAWLRAVETLPERTTLKRTKPTALREALRRHYKTASAYMADLTTLHDEDYL